MSFSSLSFQKVLVLISLISSITSSKEEFCQIKQFKSVFNIDKDIYFVVPDQNEAVFWRYDPESNDMVIDNQMKPIVSKLNFDGIALKCSQILITQSYSVSKQIFGFKFTQLYECSKDPENCRKVDFMFEGIEHCNQSLNYCREVVNFEDIIILIGFNSESKQTYHSLKSNSSGLTILEETDIMPKVKSHSNLTESTLFKIPNNSVLISIIYNQLRYEVSMILKQDQKVELRVASLKQHSWFQYWNSYTIVEFNNAIGLIQKDSDIFAVIPRDNSLYLFEAYGPQNSSRRFVKTNSNLKSLFNCSGNTTEDNITPISSRDPTDMSSSSGSTSTRELVETSSQDNMDLSELPDTDPWLLLIIPIIVLILVVFSAIIAYFWFFKPKHYNQNYTQLKPQTKDIQSILNRDSNN